jgi:HK97 family phage portal protein
MARWKIIPTKEYEGLQAEIKGYQEETQEQNAYLEALQRQLHGLHLPDPSAMGRLQIREVYETSAPVMGVVNYIADNVGEVMTYLELTHNGEYVEKHPLLDTLRRPNDRFNLKKFGTAWAVNRLLFGDAWTYVTRKMGKDGGWQLYIIPSQRVAVKNGAPLIEGIQMLGVPDAKTIPMSEVFESFDYNLDDTSFFGTSKVAAAAVYLDVMEKGMRRQDTSLETGGATHLITPKPDATGTVMPKDAAEVEKLANGSGSIGKKRALAFPVEVHQLGSTPVDLNILSSHKEAVTALCFVFRLPVDLYYGQSKYENAKEAKKTIYEQNAIPMANEFAADLLHFLRLDEQGYELKVNTDRIDVLKDDSADVLDNLAKMHASLNELREAYGYDRIEESWADQPMLPMGQMFGNEFGDIDIDENNG